MCLQIVQEPYDGTVGSRKWNKEHIVNRRKGVWGKAESKTLMDELRTQAKAAGSTLDCTEMAVYVRTCMS